MSAICWELDVLDINLTIWSSEALQALYVHKHIVKNGLFAKPKTCENWLCLVNSCIYFAHWTCEIYQVLPCSVDFKALGSWVKQYLVDVVLFGIKAL